MYIEIRKNRQDAIWRYPDKRKKMHQKWKYKLDLAHGKHIPNRVLTPLTHLNMANKQGSVLQGFAVTRIWFGFDEITFHQLLLLRKRISVKMFFQSLLVAWYMPSWRLLTRELHKESWEQEWILRFIGDIQKGVCLQRHLSKCSQAWAIECTVQVIRMNQNGFCSIRLKN